MRGEIILHKAERCKEPYYPAASVSDLVTAVVGLNPETACLDYGACCNLACKVLHLLTELLIGRPAGCCLASCRGGIGRKLDFLAQEMNREANTILSKANDLEISNKGIELKTAIEKVREQIQNIE